MPSGLAWVPSYPIKFDRVGAMPDALVRHNSASDHNEFVPALAGSKKPVQIRKLESFPREQTQRRQWLPLSVAQKIGQ